MRSATESGIEMTESLRAKLMRRLAVMVLLFALGTPTGLAQQNPPISQETVLTFVHDFLQVFYPELLSKGHRLELSVVHPAEDSWREISGVYFTVMPEVPPDYGFRGNLNGQPIPEDRPNPSSILLSGDVWLPPIEHGSRIEQVDTSSGGANERKLTILRELVQSHPEWSDAQAIGALKQAGARFGPDEKQSLINSLPLGKAERFLGALKITSVEFNHLPPDRVGSFAATALDWTVRAEARFSVGTDAEYVFGFEPFEGKLTFLMKH